ncbi:MAG: hypothetical protein NWE89_16470 [Candidatus Bathyarchaeota archaeon]|nr:hypothetical protein [Candidatus Bathyarchaeota archaeon]
MRAGSSSRAASRNSAETKRRTWRTSSSGSLRGCRPLPLSLEAHLFKRMLQEELRLHQSLVGGIGSAMFPFIIFIFTAFCAVITPFILGNIEVGTVLLMLHVASLFYGIFVGGFGMIGEHVMTRRLGQVNMLLQLPLLYPLSFRRVMGIFYVKDALFYLIYSYVPLVLGIGVATPFANVSAGGVLMLGVTMFITFMMGMGLSFLLSALSVRSKAKSLLLALCFMGLGSLVYPFGILQPYHLLPPLGYWNSRNLLWLAGSTVLAVVSATMGSLVMKERYEVRQRRYEDSLLSVEEHLGVFGELRTLVAKEWLELARSGSIGPTVMGFTGHLLAVYFISWLFENGFGLPIRFNVVFFSGFVGFMGVMTYSFLTNLEHNEYLNVLPVSVDMVVKAKLAIYFILTSGVTAGYVVLIGYLKGEMHLVPQSLFVAGCTSIFVVAVTAYLTGLWTNTMFFGAKTLLKFTGMVVPPLTLIEIGSMMIQFNPPLASKLIWGTSVFSLIAAAFLFMRLGDRWRGKSFSYVSTGV